MIVATKPLSQPPDASFKPGKSGFSGGFALGKKGFAIEGLWIVQ